MILMSATFTLKTEPAPVSGRIPAVSGAFSAPVLLRARGIRKTFGGQVVLDRVDLDLHQGEVVLLRGENGSGKTTLLNILTGILEPDRGTIHFAADSSPRSYAFPRSWWQELNPRDHFRPEFVAREGIGRTWQDIRLFSSQSLRDNIAMAEPGHPGENPMLALLAPAHCARREGKLNRLADAMLGRLGLAGREDSSADMVSLGQAKRVAIARAVAGGARILFLDEPLAGLDGHGIRDVLNLLESLVIEHKVTLVIVEHVFNQPHLEGLVTTDWLLINGALLHRGSGDARRATPGNRQRAGAIRSAEHRLAWLDLLAGSGVEVIDEVLPRGALLTRIRRPEVFHEDTSPVLALRDLVVRRGSRPVIGLDDLGNLAGFSLAIREGETVVLQAPNGWGKSTLLAAIGGLVRPDSGSIILDGRSIEELPTWERVRLGIQLLLSDQRCFPGLLARETLRMAGSCDRDGDLGALLDRRCSSLSGGERQRVALSAMTSGRVAVFDEPFSALDETNTSRLFASRSFASFPAQLFLLPGQA